MKRYRLTLLIGILTLTTSVPLAMGWWQFVHGLLGVDSGLSISPGYHQAPDTWESYHIGWEELGITDEFCWTHISPRTDWAYILRPWYYNSGPKYQDNDPAEHMRILIEKLRPDHRVLPKMTDFRKGFAAHNAEDQGGVGGKHTHFDLAPCAESFIYLGRWITHRDVEKAVESVAYVDICYGGNPDLAFDPGDGSPIGLPAAPVNYAAMIDSSVGDADTDGLLCLAMKAFRKKQQTIDFDPADLKALIPKSRSEIGRSRAEKLSMSSQNLLHFDRSQYDDDMKSLYGYWGWEGPPGEQIWVVWHDPIWPQAPFWREYYDAAKQAASLVQ